MAKTWPGRPDIIQGHHLDFHNFQGKEWENLDQQKGLG